MDEKRTRPPEDLAPRESGFAGMVAIKDAAPILRNWIKGGIVLLAISIATNIVGTFVMYGIYREVARMRFGQEFRGEAGGGDTIRRDGDTDGNGLDGR